MAEIEAGEPREEPNCGGCNDCREIWHGPASSRPMKVSCPECSPISDEHPF